MGYTIKEVSKQNLNSSQLVLKDISVVLEQFTTSYPEINFWFESKVVPGIKTRERKILYATEGNVIVALSILKYTAQEKKICTFYISPEARGKGLAEKMFKQSFTRLRTEKPFISVPENTICRFKKYFDSYNFNQTNTRLLADKKTWEFEFNGS